MRASILSIGAREGVSGGSDEAAANAAAVEEKKATALRNAKPATLAKRGAKGVQGSIER